MHAMGTLGGTLISVIKMWLLTKGTNDIKPPRRRKPITTIIKQIHPEIIEKEDTVEL